MRWKVNIFQPMSEVAVNNWIKSEIKNIDEMKKKCKQIMQKCVAVNGGHV